MIRRLSALSCSSALLLLAFGPVSAQAAEAGGAGVPDAPTIDAVTCVTGEPWACRAGEQLVVRGAGLDAVGAVVLLGGPRPRDDRRAKARPSSPQELTTLLPRGARTGRLKLVGTGGSVVSRQPVRLLEAPDAPAADPLDGPVALKPGEALYAGSRKQAVFPVEMPNAGTVEAYDVATSTAVRSWPLPAGPGEVRWDGTVDGQPVADGRYAFRVAGVTAARAASASIVVHDAVFPIRGKHDLGQTHTNDFGGARGHGGQDLFAACGTPLVAVRPGKILMERFQSAAGNYAVIQDASGQSYVYMHMRDRSLVPKDGLVKAGQPIGYVGLTGRTSGCHLHFELWTAPGWYTGGKAIDPLPELSRWDAFR